jgi:hypothetical protein
LSEIKKPARASRRAAAALRLDRPFAETSSVDRGRGGGCGFGPVCFFRASIEKGLYQKRSLSKKARREAWRVDNLLKAHIQAA